MTQARHRPLAARLAQAAATYRHTLIVLAALVCQLIVWKLTQG